MKRILVIGSSGFIGTNIVERLIGDKEYVVLGLDAREPKIPSHREIWVKADILRKDDLIVKIRSFKPDYVIHPCRANRSERKKYG